MYFVAVDIGMLVFCLDTSLHNRWSSLCFVFVSLNHICDNYLFIYNTGKRYKYLSDMIIHGYQSKHYFCSEHFRCIKQNVMRSIKHLPSLTASVITSTELSSQGKCKGKQIAYSCNRYHSTGIIWGVIDCMDKLHVPLTHVTNILASANTDIWCWLLEVWLYSQHTIINTCVKGLYLKTILSCCYF